MYGTFAKNHTVPILQLWLTVAVPFATAALFVVAACGPEPVNTPVPTLGSGQTAEAAEAPSPTVAPVPSITAPLEPIRSMAKGQNRGVTRKTMTEPPSPTDTSVPLPARSPEPVTVVAEAQNREPDTRLATTTITFTDVAGAAGVDFHHTRDDSRFNIGGGAAAGDYNGDGLLDIYVTNSAGANALYLNNGDGTFTDVAEAAGVDDPTGHGNSAGWGDYDNDGDLDLFVSSFGASKLFRNSGDRTFIDVTVAAGLGDPDAEHRTTGITWGDYDRDAYLDLLVVRYVSEADPQVFISRDFTTAVRSLALYHNNGNRTFTNVTSLLGDIQLNPGSVVGAGFKPSFVDYDNDGDPDIYVVNDFGVEHYPNVLWRNDGPDGSGGWIFTDVSAASGADAAIFGMGLAVGDYDNDSDLDFYMTNMGDSAFLENQGDGTFAHVTERTGTGRGKLPGDLLFDLSVGWGSTFADLDNDGLLDLYYVAGQMDSDPFHNPLRQPNAVFWNNGDGAFSDVSEMSGADDDGIGREAICADFDNDGLLDLFVVNMGRLDGTPGVARLFKNVSDSNNHWLRVKTVGTTSNRDGIGARINVTSGGVTQIREMGASQAHMSHSVLPVHFGLGSATRADVVEIRWPNGIIQTLFDVPADQMLIVTER